MAMKSLLTIALEWATRSFGESQMLNPGTRSLRVVEEAIELAQACNVPEVTIELCVSQVYGRPKGVINQEVGGVLMTIYLFIAGLGHLYGSHDPEEYFVDELCRVLAKPPKHFADRNAAKIEAGLEVPTPVKAATQKTCPTCGGNCGQC